MVEPVSPLSHQLPRVEGSLYLPEGNKSSSKFACSPGSQQSSSSLLHQEGRIQVSTSQHGHAPAHLLFDKEGWFMSAAYLSGLRNVIADTLSQKKPVSTEWISFQRIQQLSPPPEIDIFATRLNHHLPQYVSPVVDPKGGGHKCVSTGLEQVECSLPVSPYLSDSEGFAQADGLSGHHLSCDPQLAM